MSVLSVPEPSGWQSGQRKWGWAAVVLVVLCGWLAFRGAEATMRGNYLTTAVVAGWIAPLLLGVVALMRISVWPPSLRASVDTTGTKLRPDIWMGVLLLIGGILAIPSAVLIVIFVPRGEIDLPMSRGMQIFLPIVMVCALLVLIPGLTKIFRRRGAGYIKLTPYQVEYADVDRTRFAVWEDVDAVVDHVEGLKARKPAVLRQREGNDLVVEGLDLYVAGGAPLYWMIRHYWLNPDDRTELVDGRALERLKSGRFDIDQTNASNS